MRTPLFMSVAFACCCVSRAMDAPQADAVRVSAGDIPNLGQTGVMTKAENGVWSFTSAPLPPGAYRYNINVDGVAAIHATGHLHRDLKPANMLVSRDRCLVIVDFGLVADFSSSAAAARALPGVGRPSHMAPEQLLGDPIDARAGVAARGEFDRGGGEDPVRGDARGSGHETNQLVNNIP